MKPVQRHDVKRSANENTITEYAVTTAESYAKIICQAFQIYAE